MLTGAESRLKYTTNLKVFDWSLLNNMQWKSPILFEECQKKRRFNADREKSMLDGYRKDV